MRDFALTIENPAMSDSLLSALSGGRPFRRFKDAIAHYAAEEERWYVFRDEGVRQRLLDWLTAEDIEVIE
jgi:hypothetical protein